MQFTDEQQAAIDLAAKGVSFSLVAPAGSGKSATAVGMGAKRSGLKVLYLVYNTQARREAEVKFKNMPWVDVRTTSQVAWRAYTDKRTFGAEVAGKYAERMNPKAQAIPASELAKRMKLKPEDFGDGLVLDGYTQAKLAYDAIERFCNGSRPKITARDVPLTVLGMEGGALEAARIHIAKLAQKVWQRSIEPDSNLRFTMNYAFKLVADGGANYGYDVVIVDEAQDCQPPGTLVQTPDGVRKIEDIRVGDLVIAYDQKLQRMRVRGRRVNAISSKPHKGELVKVETENGLSSRYTPEHICIVQVRDAFAGKSLVYLMKKGNSWRVGITRDSHGSSSRACNGVAGRMYEEKGEAIWILGAFDSVREATVEEAFISAEYGIPQTRFHASGHKNVTQEMLDSFWARIGDNTERAERCLGAYGRSVKYPLATRSVDDAGKRSSYFLRTRATEMRACNVMSGMYMIDAGRVTGPDYRADRKSEAWVPVRVTRQPYEGEVWSMDVDTSHTYVADGLVTHNCNDTTMKFIKNQKGAQAILIGDPAQALYSWRGATDQIMKFDGPRLHLTQSFRFGEAVAEEAMKHLAHTRTGVTIKGLPTIKDMVTEGQMPDPDVVLSRSNAGAMEWAMSYLSVGKRVALVRGKEQIESLAYAAADLMKGEKPNNVELSAFETWGDLVQYSDEPGGGHLKPLVRLVGTYGVGRLIDACKKIVNYSARYPKHDVAISTCHSIKGLEWKKVQIADDFREPNPVKDPETGVTTPGQILKDEAMIHYVAVTRAQEHLDRSGLTWVDSYPAPEPVKTPAAVSNG